MDIHIPALVLLKEMSQKVFSNPYGGGGGDSSVLLCKMFCFCKYLQNIEFEISLMYFFPYFSNFSSDTNVKLILNYAKNFSINWYKINEPQGAIFFYLRKNTVFHMELLSDKK